MNDWPSILNSLAIIVVAAANMFMSRRVRRLEQRVRMLEDSTLRHLIREYITSRTSG